MGNEIQLLFDSSSSALRQMQGGRVRGLAVASKSRLSAAPKLPTFEESGLKGFVSTLGHGVVVPAATPHTVVAAINGAINTVLNDTDYRKMMIDDGVHIVGGSPERFAEFLANERKKWSALVQKLGIKAQ
jgi:tripartite-type tricarboxylate transporter receptor subunit TctC